MTLTTIRLDEAVYERLKAAKRSDETFSEAVDRLLSGRSHPDLVGLWSEAEVEMVRATLDVVDRDAAADVTDLVDRIESG